MAAGIGVAALTLFWVALASRQLLTIPDVANHMGLSASIRAGAFPPAFFWTPEFLAPYHYGQDLLIGLLAPPVGPDLAFTTELLGAYGWASFVLVVVTALLGRASGFAVLVTAPASAQHGGLVIYWRARRHRAASDSGRGAGGWTPCLVGGHLLAVG